MVETSDLAFCLSVVLRFTPGPGLSARALAWEVRDWFGIEVRKSEINAVLYRRRDLFQFDGYSPPIWSLNLPPSGRGFPSWVHEREESKGSKGGPGTEPTFSTSELRTVSPASAASNRLHAWQQEAIAAWSERGGRGIVEAVTGTGKSRVATEILRDFVAQDRRALILVPSIVLQAQWAEVVASELGITVSSFIGGNRSMRFNPACPITIGLVQSVFRSANALDRFFDVLVADECHHYGAEKYRRGLLPGVRWRLGLTATLERSDDGIEEALDPYFGGICFRYGCGEARRDGVIAPYSVVALGVDLNSTDRDRYDVEGQKMGKAKRELVETFGVRSSPIGEFMKDMERAASNSWRARMLAQTYRSAMQMRKKILAESNEKLAVAAGLADAINAASQTLVFTETKKGAESIADRLSDRVRVEVYHSDLDSGERERVLAMLSEGDVQCVAAVRCLDEGVDVRDIDLGVIMASSTSKRQMIQRMGRVLRQKKDRRGAVFIVVYANDTAEDPFARGDEESHLDQLLEHADASDVLNAASVRPDDLARQVRSWIGRTRAVGFT